MEGASLEVRVEFTNIFNRAAIPNPDAANARATQTRDPISGRTVSGFGRINAAQLVSGASFIGRPREGQFLVRIRF